LRTSSRLCASSSPPGAQTHQEVTDVGGGNLTATVKDADGNITGLIQAPWPLNPRKVLGLITGCGRHQ